MLLNAISTLQRYVVQSSHAWIIELLFPETLENIRLFAWSKLELLIVQRTGYQ